MRKHDAIINRKTMRAERIETLPGGGLYGGKQIETLPGGGFH